ncbi:hypothetical protein HMPREF0262_02354 [Clostridium sp. ATCC 29733]|nr:hypothetical protein HMPREF0262_02354 [Clostridium sp. ATCC 29733]
MGIKKGRSVVPPQLVGEGLLPDIQRAAGRAQFAPVKLWDNGFADNAPRTGQCD